MYDLSRKAISSKSGKSKGNGWNSQTLIYHGLNLRHSILKRFAKWPRHLYGRDNEFRATSKNILIKGSSCTFARVLPGDGSCPWLAQAIGAFKDLKEAKFASAERINISFHSHLKAFAPTLYNYFSFHQKILLDSLFLPQFQNYSMSACSGTDMYIWH